MPLAKITLRPGTNRQLTPTLNEGGFSDSNLVRYRNGLPQPIGGWAKSSGAQFQGVCRGMHAWTTLAGVPTIGMGTHLRLYIYQGQTFYDVTPIQNVVATTNPFATTAGSPVVVATAPAHGAFVGDFVEIPSSTVGGLTLAGEYVITSVPTINTFTVTAAANATTPATGGGSVTFTFPLSVGAVDSSLGLGWGVGPFGGGTFGTTRSGSTLILQARLWSIDSWGEEMVACPRGGAIYNWKPSGGLGSRAAPIAGAPAYNNAILTGLPERHLISFGAESGGVLDPMLIRWSDTENYSAWNATANNAAGSYRIAGGNQIMRAIAGQGEILVWTDAVLYAMRFQGYPYIYGFYQLGRACGLISPGACAVLGGVAYWMSQDRFMTYSGDVAPLHCDVWDAVFRNMNPLQTWKAFAAVNASFSEVAFFYASAGSQEIDSLAVYDREGGTWWLGQIARTAWEDLGSFANPIAAGADGYLYAHEFGTDADGSPMDSFAQSGFFDIADGEAFSMLDHLIPDFGDQAGNVLVTIQAQETPNGPTTTKGPFVVGQATRFLSARLRGRQLAIRFESGGLGSFWKLGAVRARVRSDGRR